MFGTEYAAYKHILETEDEKVIMYNQLNKMKTTRNTIKHTIY